MYPSRVALALLAVLGSTPLAMHPRAARADGPDAAPPPSRSCREVRADPDLIRSNYVPIGRTAADDRHRRALAEASIRFRTVNYGYFPGFGSASDNPHAPSFYATDAHFMGLTVRLNRRIVPALACVEADIARNCTAHPYHPHHLVGLRPANSYAGHEVSNHVYGLAIDIDASHNPCCGCGAMYRDSPGCRRHARTVWERMEMPECWVDAFERHGFYWLGHDANLHDLMHFEYLAAPAAD